MTSSQSQQPHFEQQFQNETLHRGKRYGKKKRSWVSFILTLIALVLTIIAAYSMYTENLFRMVILDQNVTYDQFKVFTSQLSQQSFIDLSDFETRLNQLLLVLNVFFILSLVSILLGLITLIFNRTVLKLINFVISVILLIIPVGFLFIIRYVASSLSKELSQYLGDINPQALLIESSAIHNAIIFMAIATILYFIALFFRNRRPKVR
ncbi:hypothetical protein [Staphylococcus canis]|uniref:ABC transporter permease n=1 Tax=Staphylococcus canis TaxID=2724942 RepID=A0ABS0T6C0_9STAP|nr:hypothetical protein [Staphylococcus canis]MBI5974297.1 hypothetical protein [Staphylococcus canis]